MHKEAKEELRVIFKHTVLELASYQSATKVCEEFNVPRSTYYRWKQKYDQEGRAGLYLKKPLVQLLNQTQAVNEFRSFGWDKEFSCEEVRRQFIILEQQLLAINSE